MVSQPHALVPQLADDGNRCGQSIGAHARHSGRADGRDDASGNHARNRSRAGAAAQHDRLGVVPRRLAAQSVVHARVRRERHHHGLRASELHRAAGRRLAAQGLHPSRGTVRRLRDQLGLSRDRGTDGGSRAGHATSLAHAADWPVPVSLRVAATGGRRSAQPNGRSGRRPDQGVDVLDDELQARAPKLGSVDVDAGRGLHRAARAVRGDGIPLVRQHEPRGHHAGRR